MRNDLESKMSLRSPEMQKLISDKGAFITRWPLLIFLFIFVLILACTWLFKYPDIVKGNAVLSAVQEGYISVTISQTDFSKIRTGQKVQLRFDAYPYQEFGFVEGNVVYVSPTPSTDGFRVNVALKNSLMTSLNKIIPNKSGLKAQAIIVTRETRLVERLFNFF